MEKSIILKHKDKVNRCLSCGTTENMKRRKYCSIDCRRRLMQKLDMRTGLIRALNVRYATFYFTDILIMMDVLLYGDREIFCFSYTRTPGKTPAEDFSTMANILGDIWWIEQKRTSKRYLASRRVLAEAVRKEVPIVSVRPLQVFSPAVAETSLNYLELRHSDLGSPELSRIVKQAFRRRVMQCHPDQGGDALTFRKVRQAYEDLMGWLRNPVYVRKRGFPDKWFFDGERDKWTQPFPSITKVRAR